MQDKQDGHEGDKVGYRNPPKNSRFKKGKSGNPKGRPKGAKNKAVLLPKGLESLVLAEAEREVSVQDQGGSRKISMIQAALRALALKSAKGNAEAQRILIPLVKAAETSKADAKQQVLEYWARYKYQAERDLDNYKSWNETPIEVIPHPDDINIDYQTGEVFFTGPVDADEKANWDTLTKIKRAPQDPAVLMKLQILRDNHTQGPRNTDGSPIRRITSNMSVQEAAKLYEKTRLSER